MHIKFLFFTSIQQTHKRGKITRKDDKGVKKTGDKLQQWGAETNFLRTKKRGKGFKKEKKRK